MVAAPLERVRALGQMGPVTVVHGLSDPAVWGLSEQAPNLSPLYCKVGSEPLDHQGGALFFLFKYLDF